MASASHLVLTRFGNSSIIKNRIPEMFRETTAAQLSAFPFRADAKRCFCLLPLGGIYWEDEIPEWLQLLKFPEEDRNQIYRLFGIRYRIWKAEVLPDHDQRFWDAACAQVPDWAFFQRVRVTVDDQLAQDQAERTSEEGFKALFAEADQLTVSEEYPGVQAFSATFDLTKRGTAEAKPWWARMFRKGTRRKT